MRTKYISIVTFLLCLFVTAPDINAKGGKFFKWLGKNLGSAAAGWVDKTVEKNLSSEEHRETWRGIVSDINSSMGINESYANAGRNWAEGKKKDSFVDIGEAALSDAGVNNAGVRTAFDFARIQNNYNRDIQSGMSTKEAYDRRLESVKQLLINVGSNAFEDASSSKRYNQWLKEEKAWEGKHENEIYHELLRRGYSRDETQMYMTVIHENPGLLRGLSGGETNESNDSGLSYAEKNKKYRESIENLTNMLIYDEDVQSKIKKILDDLNIPDRSGEENFNYSDYENSFFGTPPLYMPEPEDKNEGNVETPEETPQTSPIPVVDERANAVRGISGTVLSSYAINDVELSDDQKADLDQVADMMNKYEDIQIDIFGHTCNIGTQKINQNIGERRAMAAKKYLLSKGVSGNRIQVESRDFSEPIVENDTEEHRKQNRRVTFKVK